MKMKAILAAAAATAGLLAAQSAAAQDVSIANPKSMAPNLDPEHIGSVLTDLGIAWTERTAANGRRYIRATVGDEFTFEIIPSACIENDGLSGCVGANFLARYTGREPNQQSVEAFNQNFVFTTAGMLPNRSGGYISRYEIADFGIPRGNLASSIGSFLYLASRFRSEIESSPRTVSQNGFADDMAARLLNRRVSESLGVRRNDLGESAFAMHKAGFEETVEIVNMLAATPDAPANKIRNLNAE